jgi:hypothetical protein
MEAKVATNISGTKENLGSKRQGKINKQKATG